ncbi:hypothetical protein K505DRAFT_387669 [Melanomma pulvis-pyrius CBS 109.77]|uniref:RING-type domain-containing protein n=1 Tax=Melanomma pulvis-pyrius CBS 109.77 TaxID=1314802 RepID=A0A6A6XVL7_9PLEO|nr:hypothetical protein K505DRAFT_387669 [Melanomma pulvis-pyrius CBS 109.77]
MESFIQSELQPTDECGICTEIFGEGHLPVALKCRHIFGHECLLRWLRGGRSNNMSCPFCRDTIYEENRGDEVPFEMISIWNALCKQAPESLDKLISEMWRNLQVLRENNLARKYKVKDLLNDSIFPALVATASGQHGPFEDCYSLIAVSYASLGQPETAQGLAMPLIRLARLMDQAWYSIPDYLATLQRTNVLFWKANACIDVQSDSIHWDFINEASALENERYFPLLHLYTVLISQIVAHHPQSQKWPERRHERMNLVVVRCCKAAIGGAWKGNPSNALKDKLVVVYDELRRHQLDAGRISLRGNEGEEYIVRGLWQIAGWTVRRGMVR